MAKKKKSENLKRLLAHLKDMMDPVVSNPTIMDGPKGLMTAGPVRAVEDYKLLIRLAEAVEEE